MIHAQVYGGPIDGLEVEIEEVPGIIYFLDATPRVSGLTQYPDHVIEKLRMDPAAVKVYILVPKQRGDILILDWFEKVERNLEQPAD